MTNRPSLWLSLVPPLRGCTRQMAGNGIRTLEATPRAACGKGTLIWKDARTREQKRRVQMATCCPIRAGRAATRALLYQESSAHFELYVFEQPVGVVVVFRVDWFYSTRVARKITGLGWSVVKQWKTTAP